MRKAVLLFLFLLFTRTAAAQVVPVQEPVELEPDVSYSILPIGAYTSDEGLFGGVIMQRLNYSDDQFQPFLSSMRAEVFAGTRGKIESRFDYERMSLFGREIRNLTRVDLVREPRSVYYGIGNNTLYRDTDFADGRYYYSRNIMSLNFLARKNWTRFSDNGRVDCVMRLMASHLWIEDRGEDTVFFDDRPFGEGGGWVNKTGIGLIVDNRPSEFSPNAGYRYETGINVSGSYLGSSYSFADMFVDLRQYISPLGDIVLAQKIEVRHTAGDAPFWQKPVLGNQYGLRGYPLDRFIGQSSVLHILEARKWLFSLFDDGVQVGGHFFWDSGRVFSRFDENAVFTGWKHSFGVGGAVTLFNPDLIVRGEMGFSDESIRIYAGIGYLF